MNVAEHFVPSTNYAHGSTTAASVISQFFVDIAGQGVHLCVIRWTGNSNNLYILRNGRKNKNENMNELIYRKNKGTQY